MSKRTKYLLGIGVIAALVIGWQVAAFAVHDEGKFELEGNATSANAPAPRGPADDWDRVCHQVTITEDTTNQIPDQCTSASDTTGATAVAWEAEADRSASIFTGGGSKDPNDIPSWRWKNGGGLPDKDNLLHAFAARYTADGQELLYFGSDRFDNSGDAVQGFWFFKDEVSPNANGTFSGTHQNGDLLILSDFSNGGDVSTIAVYKWDNGNLTQLASSNVANCANPNLGNNPAGGPLPNNPPGTSDQFCGIVSPLLPPSGTGTTPSPWTFLDKSGKTGFLGGELFEGGVNLSALGLSGQCFATVAAETRSSTSTTATLKDFVLGKFGECGSTTTTQSTPTGNSNSIGNGSVTTSDSATVTVEGAATWNGTVQFYLCGPSDSITTCEAAPENEIGDPVPVSNNTTDGTVTSDEAAVTSKGTYCWGATFVPENPTDLEGSADDGENECFTVVPVTPALDTDAGDGPVDFGQPITDTATLTGTANQPDDPVITYPTTDPPTLGDPAGGTITFTLFGPSTATNACGPQVTANGQPVTFTRDVSGDGTYPTANQQPVSFTPTQPGTYHWKATYSGNLPNTLGASHNDTCSDSDESVVVNQVTPTISTNQRWLPNDSATITANGGGNLSGNVRFRLYDNAQCSGTPLYDSGSVAVSGGSPQTVSSSNTTALTSSATVSWLVEYTSNNPAQTNVTSTCNTEHSSLTIDNG